MDVADFCMAFIAFSLGVLLLAIAFCVAATGYLFLIQNL